MPINKRYFQHDQLILIDRIKTEEKVVFYVWIQQNEVKVVDTWAEVINLINKENF